MTESPWTAPGSDGGDPTGAPPAPYDAPAPPSYAAPALVPAPAPYPPPPGSHPLPPPPRAAWRPALDFRPGIIPLRPLQLGDLFSGVFKAIRGNVAATVGLAALTSALFLVPFTALGTWVASLDDTSLTPTSTSGVDTPFSIGMLGSYLPSIGSAFSAILLAGFLAHVIGQAVLGRKVTMGQTWAGTKGRLGALVGATLLVIGLVLVVLLVGVGIPVLIGLAIAAGGSPGRGAMAGLVALGLLWLLLLILVLLVITTRLSFMTPALVLERLGVTASLRRSWRLVGSPRTKAFWRVLGLRLLTSLVVSMASSVVMVPVMVVMFFATISLVTSGGAASDLYMLQTVVTGLASILAGALTTPFTAGVDALLYVDARIRQEGLDVTLMRACEGSAPPPWPSAPS